MTNLYSNYPYDYDSGDLTYNAELVYDTVEVLAGNDIITKKRFGGRSKSHKDEYTKNQLPFISIVVTSTIKSVNDKRLSVEPDNISFAGEESPIKIGVDAIKVRTSVSPISSINSNFIEKAESVANSEFLNQGIKNLHNVQSTLQDTESKNPLIIEGGNFIETDNFLVSAGLITNSSQNLIIKSEILITGTI